jgi:hypothetical protein
VNLAADQRVTLFATEFRAESNLPRKIGWRNH